MKRFRVVHTTQYQFSDPVRGCRIEAMLRPRETAVQTLDYFQVVSRPPGSRLTAGQDAFGNTITHLEIEQALQRLTLSAISTVSVQPPVAIPSMDPAAVRLYLQPTVLVPLDDRIADYGRSCRASDLLTTEAVERLIRRIQADVAFRAGVTDIHTTARQVLDQRQGVCQDFAHLTLAVLRAMRIPARYVSGYLHTAAQRGKAHRIAADDSHAWVEVLDADAGWMGFDPANGRRVNDDYIVVARGLDYGDVCPLRGTFNGGGAHRLEVAVDVQQI